CGVCLTKFEDNAKLHLLPRCSHVFHLDCIDAWLTSHVTCLIYRANLAKQAADNNLDLLHITTLDIDATGLQSKTIVPPQDHVAIVIDP
ncbi:hypothetical protein B296_00012469, partial [Ensete ventricosum]